MLNQLVKFELIYIIFNNNIFLKAAKLKIFFELSDKRRSGHIRVTKHCYMDHIVHVFLLGYCVAVSVIVRLRMTIVNLATLFCNYPLMQTEQIHPISIEETKKYYLTYSHDCNAKKQTLLFMPILYLISV